MTRAPSGNDAEQALRIEIAATARWLHQRGWTPATSSNFSARLSATEFLVSVSGIDKERFSPEDSMCVDLDGRSAPGEERSCSAETPLHAAIYRSCEAGSVIHVHSTSATVLSRLLGSAASVDLGGYELLKAFSGIRSHEARIRVPIFPNSQDMARLSADVVRWLASERKEGRPAFGFLLEAHGLYAWGTTIRDARRHVEAFDFLFECELKATSLRGANHPPTFPRT